MTIAQQLNVTAFPFIIKDANGKKIYGENSDGVIRDNRLKQVELTLEQIAAKLGINVSQLRIKD